ncbi:MAG TPA: amidohydrolase family protein [Xanthobacteraceae bacterium]|jgi:2,3-dihydroxybenzoate decarboxylase|nr:amidohydrolase family protein [Xanthobacteraceae bacterium]
MKVIAIEEHFILPEYRRKYSDYLAFLYRSMGDEAGHDIAGQLLDLADDRLRFMDAAGVDIQVLSFTAPGPQALDKEAGVAMAVSANNQLKEAIDKHPDRFAGFAMVPTADPEAAARELERAVKELGFKGTMIHGHHQGSFLDDKKYWPIFETAAKLDVPVYLHPTVPPLPIKNTYFAGYEELEGAAWGFGVDTSCHFLRLMFSGLFDAYPNLQIILGHLGETLPFAMHRMHAKTFHAAQRRGLKKTPLQYIRDNLIVTPSGNWYEPAFMCTLLALGADRIIWAVDWPYEANTVAMDFFRRLPLNDTDKEKIAHLNAERVLHL